MYTDITIISFIIRSEEVRMMERKVRDIACHSEYKRKLVEGYREVTMDCLMEVRCSIGLASLLYVYI